MGIATIEQAIADIFASVTSIKKVYFRPVTEIGRQLPALVIRYNGFEQVFATMDDKYRIVYHFAIDLFYPADGKTFESSWNNLKNLVPDIVAAFRSDFQLRGTCLMSNLESGEPVITTEATPHIGHTFRLRVETIEE